MCEGAGVVCAILTYVIVLTVQIGMIRVGVWEGLLQGELSSIVNIVIFQYHCIMIYLTHFKCMTTEPGVLPKNYDSLSFKKIAPALSNAIMGVKKEIDHMKVDHSGQKAQIDAIDRRITEQIKNIDNMNEKQVQESKLKAQ